MLQSDTTAPVLVRKYGGSSLATIERIKAVATDLRRAHDDGYRLVVVVSAMGQTTDELNALALQINGTPPRRELDMLLSVGERITMSLLSMALVGEGCPAISFTGSQCGIITDNSHNDARILEVRGDRIRDALKQGNVVVVAGYQGVSRDKEITTLGRGGSDTTAVALAAALGAVRCEILKDVDGICSADPQFVPNPNVHRNLDWDQMHDVATSGCGVVHIRAIEYAARHAVPLVVRSSFHDGPGTVISQPEATPSPTVSPTCHGRYRPLTIHVAPQVTRIYLTTDRETVGQRWRDILLTHLDPAATITEWLDSSRGFRWEGLTKQRDLRSLRAVFDQDNDCPENYWQEELTCVSLAGGRPDSWLEVQRYITTVLDDLKCHRWHLRADGSSLRILLQDGITPGLIEGLHQALLRP